MNLTVKSEAELHEAIINLSGYHQLENVSKDSFRYAQLVDIFHDRLDVFLQMSINRKKIEEFLEANHISYNESTYLLCEVVQQALDRLYLPSLLKFEEEKSYRTPINKLLDLLKYQPLLNYIRSIINDLNEENQIVLLFKLLNFIEDQYNLHIELEVDPFYHGVITWLSHGRLPIHYKNNFFICFDSNQQVSFIDLKKLPHFVDHRLAFEIHDIGNMVRYLQRHKICFEFNDSNLYWQKFDNRGQLYKVNALFKEFVYHFKSQVFRYVLENTNLRQIFLENFLLLKLFYFVGSETFWSNFDELLQASSEDGTVEESWNVRKCFHQALFATFDEDQATKFNELVSIRRSSRRAGKSFSLAVKIPKSVQIIINDQCLRQYELIFTCLHNIQISRQVLIKVWRNRIITRSEMSMKEGNKRWYLVHSLLQSLNTIYLYVKLNIEQVTTNFLETFERTFQIDEIKLNKVLLSLIDRLFIKDNYTFSLISALLKLCHTLAENDFDRMCSK